MMKLRLLTALALGGTLLFGCSSGSSNDSKSSDGTVSNTAYVEVDDGEISATVTKKDGKVTAVEIDETTSDGESKKAMGTDYGLKSKSAIGKEWDEQIQFLENYLVEHGVDSVKLNSDGYAEEEDVRAGCSINLKDIMKAVDDAAAK